MQPWRRKKPAPIEGTEAEIVADLEAWVAEHVGPDGTRLLAALIERHGERLAAQYARTIRSRGRPLAIMASVLGRDAVNELMPEKAAAAERAESRRAALRKSSRDSLTSSRGAR